MSDVPGAVPSGEEGDDASAPTPVDTPVDTPIDTPIDRVMPEPASDEAIYDEFIDAHERRLEDQRLSAIEAGRRKGGMAGAAMAGAMFAVAEIYEGPKKDDKPVTVEASSDPDDVDRDGIDVEVGEVQVNSPALPNLPPVVERAARRKRPQV